MKAHLTADFFFHSNKTPLGKGIYDSPHVSEVSTVSQIREVLRMLLFVSVDFHGLKLKIIQESDVLGGGIS